MKKNNRGFMLAETLLVTTFVAGILIYLYVQFSNLNTKYNEAYTYNTVENMYALVDVIDLIEDDLNALEYIEKNVVEEKYIDISNCSLFTNSDVCKKLLSIENIDEIFITTNIVPKADITSYTKGLNKFTSKINSSGEQPYRLVASFKDDTYATVRFGNGEIQHGI